MRLHCIPSHGLVVDDRFWVAAMTRLCAPNTHSCGTAAGFSEIFENDDAAAVISATLSTPAARIQEAASHVRT
jgi:hypothetical protein